MATIIREIEEEEIDPALLQAMLDEQAAAEEEEAEQADVELSPNDEEFVDNLIMTCILFIEDLCDTKFYPYQREVAYRIIESVVLGDGEEITVLQARQSGKTETLANVLAGLMILLPRLAKAYPDLLGKYAKGFWVGTFAPTEEQADTVWGRIVDRLSSERATEYLLDPEIEDKVTKEGGKSKCIRLKNSGSLCRRQTCNPKAKIESKSYHFVLVDECQEADSFVVTKSIGPMLAFYNGTRVYTGTPTREKNIFYKAIQLNKRRQTKRGVRQNHFEYNYKFVCKYNANYRKFIAKEKVRLGEDSDEFQMSYNCKWLLDQGMFITEEKFDLLGDSRMRLYKSWFKNKVVVGIDPARTKDSTVVTVVWVDWDRPDPFGFYEHRILNWLEITNKEWEKQYYEIYEFLSHYNILRIGVDSTGMGSAVYDRIRVLFPDVEVIECPSDAKTQAERWKHLTAIVEREALVYPAHSTVKRLRPFKRFRQQMIDLETKMRGPYLLAQAPDENEAHDDYPDSLAIACSMTLMDTLQEAEAVDSPFVGRRR